MLVTVGGRVKGYEEKHTPKKKKKRNRPPKVKNHFKFAIMFVFLITL